jgi:hypothetical protein
MIKRAALGGTLIALVVMPFMAASAPSAMAAQAAPAHSRPPVAAACGHTVAYGTAYTINSTSSKDDYWF